MDKAEQLSLIKQAQEGDEAAFTKLYNQYNKVVFIIIHQIVKNKDVADDLVSVTFTKAFLKIDSYINHISFEMWLKTIAVNTSIDYIRKNKKEYLNNYVDDDANTCQLESSSQSPEDSFVDKETLMKVEQAIERLRYKYRVVLKLRVFENLTYKEIAERLDMTESQVKSTLNKGREKLKQLLT